MAENYEAIRIPSTATPHPEEIFPLFLRSEFESGNDSSRSIWNPGTRNISLQYPHQPIPHELLRATVNHLIIPLICVIGILGNGFNFYVFYCRWYQKFMNDAEKSVTVGLMSLSLSDAMFCLAAVPCLFLYEPFSLKAHSSSVAALHYTVYRPFFSNLFLLNSTWLIVTISVQRLVAVTWSSRGRYCVTDPRKTALIHGGIFLAALLVCFPLLMRNSVMRTTCINDHVCYYVSPSEVLNSTPFVAAYQLFWTVFGTMLPLILLTFGNVRLIMIICRGRYSEGVGSAERCNQTQITLLVVTMIMSFLILVCPSMITECLSWLVKQQAVRPSSPADNQRFLVAVTFTNLLQAIKFSFNFLLYCTVSRKFRRQLKACRKVNDSCRANKVDQEARLRLDYKR